MFYLKSFFVVVFLLVQGKLLSQFNYAAIMIPDSLKKNANAIVRDELLEYTYLTDEKNTSKHRRVVTVLNKNGDSHALLVLPYNKFKSVNFIKGNIYNAAGMIIDKLKASDIGDFSGSAGYALFDDIRYKLYRPLISAYPYTVEYEFELSYDASIYFPDFVFFEDYNVSIERSEFRMVMPNNYRWSYKEFNQCGKAEITKGDQQTTYVWKAENIPAIDEEPFSVEAIHRFPTVLTAPSYFSLDGYTGSMDSWENYGRWVSKLNEGRDALPEARVLEIRNMVKDITDDKEKIQILYKYLQQRTRYFNISLGIGGLQPAEASTVDEVGYGDCKGLSNYMKALLKAAGIPSIYTIVEAGGSFPQLIIDFPKHQFNHVILCVPLKQDTVWLECTNQVIPFGFLGDFTSDRYALLIKDTGGELVKTPVYHQDENFQNTRVSVIISTDGNGKAEISRKFGGLQFDDHIQQMHQSADDLKKWLYDYYDMPNFQLGAYKFSADSDGKPKSELSSSVVLTNYASTSGKRLFVPLNLTSRSTYLPSKVKERKTDIRLVYPYIDTDTIEYIIPEGMDIEFIPETAEIKSVFGEYRSMTAKKDNSIIYVREVKMFKGIFPKEMYGDLIKFYYDISVADKCQAILIKKES